MMKKLNLSKAMKPDLISRNTANAYYMITRLEKLSIEPQGNDQSLNMAIPESKILLACILLWQQWRAEVVEYKKGHL